MMLVPGVSKLGGCRPYSICQQSSHYESSSPIDDPPGAGCALSSVAIANQYWSELLPKGHRITSLRIGKAPRAVSAILGPAPLLPHSSDAFSRSLPRRQSLARLNCSTRTCNNGRLVFASFPLACQRAIEVSGRDVECSSSQIHHLEHGFTVTDSRSFLIGLTIVMRSV